MFDHPENEKLLKRKCDNTFENNIHESSSIIDQNILLF